MRVRNWKKFQHFKDRRPPWIKLYRDLLDDRHWHGLPGDITKTLIGLWLLASEDKQQSGELPDVDTIAFRLRMSKDVLLQHLSALENWLDNNVISARYRVGPPETETETETETESASLRSAHARAHTRESPTDFAQWTEWLVNDRGWRPSDVHKPNVAAMCKQWVTERITLEQANEAADRAHAKCAHVTSPVLYGTFVAELTGQSGVSRETDRRSGPPRPSAVERVIAATGTFDPSTVPH